MKTTYCLNRKFLFILILTFGVFHGCRDDFFRTEEIEPIDLKSATLSTVPMSGTLPSGALYEIVLPANWDTLSQKILAVYAHGYVDFNKPVDLPNDAIGGVPIKNFLLSMNFGYASTSYRENGLVVLEGVEDIVMLHNTILGFFITNPGYQPPDAIILVGPSEGGLITVLTIEQNPTLFQGAIATCCPIGNFYSQLQYYGDAHVLFKYFFGPSLNEINLGSPKHVSPETMAAWDDGTLKAAIIGVLQDDYLYNGGSKIAQFLQCANITADTSDPVKVVNTILEVLRFPIKATNDAIERFGGNPYNNKYPKKQYIGSLDDEWLNKHVERIGRPNWVIAKQNIANYYETSGVLLTPLVNMHTEFDHVSLFSHLSGYESKVNAYGPLPDLLVSIPVPDRYGHCNFTVVEVAAALDSLFNISVGP